MRSQEQKSTESPKTISGDIYEQLKSDHRIIKTLCENITREESGETPIATQAFLQLKRVLSAHAKTEEAVFYANLVTKAETSSNRDLKSLVLESYEEHHVADRLLLDLSELDSSEENWMPKMIVLKETLEHHIKEEEGKMFKEAKDEITKPEAEVLGAKFAQQKAQFLQAN